MFSLAHSHVFSSIFRGCECVMLKFVLLADRIGRAMHLDLLVSVCSVFLCLSGPNIWLSATSSRLGISQLVSNNLICIWDMFVCCGRSCLVYNSFTSPSGGNQVDGLPPAASICVCVVLARVQQQQHEWRNVVWINSQTCLDKQPKLFR